MEVPQDTPKLEPTSSSVSESTSGLTPFEVSELTRLLTKLNATTPSGDANALLIKCSSATAISGLEQDWTVNNVVLSHIFQYLPTRNLKLARLVCKLWANVAATHLADRTVSKINGPFHEPDRALWLKRIERMTGFNLRSVKISLGFVHGRYWRSSSLEIPQKLFESPQFRTVTSLEMSFLSFECIFNLLLPCWLPKYWRNLRSLKLIEVEIFIDETSVENTEDEDRPLVNLNLERLDLEFSPGKCREGGDQWTFLRGCSKLKNLHLREIIQSKTARTSHRVYQEAVLQALGKTQLETLELQYITEWTTFSKELFIANGRNLKTFLLRVQPADVENLTASLSSCSMLPPSVDSVKLHFELPFGRNQVEARRDAFAAALPLIYHKWSGAGRRLDIQFDTDIRLIVKSSSDLVLQLKYSWAVLFAPLATPSPLSAVLQSLFPEVNYVCCACQTPRDGGTSYTTTLLERFGEKNVFDLKRSLIEETSSDKSVEGIAAFQENLNLTLFEPVGMSNKLNISDSSVISEAAVGVEGWRDEDLKTEGGNVFVFSHVTDDRMAAGWAKIQNPVHFFTSFFGTTLEAAKIGQGSCIVCRRFTTWVGESYTEMCKRS